MTERHCGNCKYYAEPTGNGDFHRCNNEKSIFKACLSHATGCNKFEPFEPKAEGEEG